MYVLERASDSEKDDEKLFLQSLGKTYGAPVFATDTSVNINLYCTVCLC